MKQETKEYIKALWEESREGITIAIVIGLMIFWGPIAGHIFTNWFESTGSDYAGAWFGTVVGGFLIGLAVLFLVIKLWDVVEDWLLDVKKNHQARMKKIEDDKRKAQREEEKRRKALQDEADRTGKVITYTGRGQHEELRPKTTSRERVIMEREGLRTYNDLQLYYDRMWENRKKANDPKPEKTSKNEKSKEKFVGKTVKSSSRPKTRLDAVG